MLGVKGSGFNVQGIIKKYFTAENAENAEIAEIAEIIY